ncbi:unnamed protein product [Lactuca saligna]|uniref:DNA mismatch repair protein S5 domain-containing protein n=1 Tax=Lactuca saligna TaxID=75948 RepID=A0AA35ZYS8_LACSI|nr:unnamed protein product [Lactuca saligna]
MDGFISDSSYSATKTTMVLFINERLAECTALKREIEIIYVATLPKASKPFIYMSLILPPEHVDVNVHPRKREVSLLNQEVIIEKIQSVIEMKLRNLNESSMYQEQQAVDCSPVSSISANKALCVSLLNQEVIIEKIQSVIEMKLRNLNESSMYQEQQAVDCSPVSSISANKALCVNTSTSVMQLYKCSDALLFTFQLIYLFMF